MKRLIVFLIAVATVLSLVACGADIKKADNTKINENGNETVTTSEKTDTKSAKLTVEDVKKAKETDASKFNYKNVEGGIAITEYKGEDEIVVIPKTIEGKSVVSIDRSAFSNNIYIKGIMISSEVQIIGERAFTNCTSLEVFVSGDAVKEIENYAFSACKSLRSVELNEGLLKLDRLCFGLTESLTEIEIPSSVTDLDDPFTDNNDNYQLTIIAEPGSKAEEFAKEKSSFIIFKAK